MPEQTTEPSEIGEFIAQSKQNATALRDLRQELADKFSELAKGIDRLRDGIYAASRPNFSNFAAFAGVILSVIIAISTPIGFFVWDKITEQAKSTTSLDEKLQREFKLSIETATQKSEAINTASRERHEQANRDADLIRSEIKDLRDWQNVLIRSDLEELRQRRLKAAQ